MSLDDLVLAAKGLVLMFAGTVFGAALMLAANRWTP